jgi:hypothetical protein
MGKKPEMLGVVMLKIKRVHSPELRDEVYALRYRAYRDIGALNEDESQRFKDLYDEQPNHILWALTEDDSVVGSIRTTWFANNEPYLIPEMDAYGDAIRSFVSNQHRLVSANRFVTDPGRADRDRHFALFLMRHVAVVAQVRADYLLAAVRANHLLFYKRVLLLNPISEGIQYPGLNSTMYLTAHNFSEKIGQIYEKTPVLKPKGYERIFFDDNYRDVWEIGLPIED